MNYLIRIEYFGGVIFNLSTFEWKILTTEEAVYLKALSLTGQHSQANEIVKTLIKLFNNHSIDFGMKLNENVIESIIKNSTQLDFETSLLIIKNKLDYVTNANHLCAPLEITIYPTLRCNLDCRFCFIENKNSTYHIEHPASYWIDIAQKAYDNDVLSLSLLGGEPTLYYDIDNLLIGLDDIGILCTITTNASQMKESTFDIIANSNTITPVISLQSLRQSNRSLMGQDYKISVDLIHKFISRGKKVRINTVYTEQSLDEIDEIIDFSLYNKIDRLSFATYFGNNPNNSLNCNHTLNDSRLLDEHIESYIESNHKEDNLNYAVEGCMLFTAYPEIEDEMIHLTLFDKLYYGCRAGISKMEIFPDGSVLPCSIFQSDQKCSSKITQENFQSVWKNSILFTALREGNASEASCIKCGFKDICRGGCPYNKYHKDTYEIINEKDPKCLK